MARYMPSYLMMKDSLWSLLMSVGSGTFGCIDEAAGRRAARRFSGFFGGLLTAALGGVFAGAERTGFRAEGWTVFMVLAGIFSIPPAGFAFFTAGLGCKTLAMLLACLAGAALTAGLGFDSVLVLVLGLGLAAKTIFLCGTTAFGGGLADFGGCVFLAATTTFRATAAAGLTFPPATFRPLPALVFGGRACGRGGVTAATAGAAAAFGKCTDLKQFRRRGA